MQATEKRYSPGLEGKCLLLARYWKFDEKRWAKSHLAARHLDLSCLG